MAPTPTELSAAGSTAAWPSSTTDVVLRYTDYRRMKFNQFLMAAYFGPGLLPHGQTLWIDELAVNRERIEPIEKE